MSTIKYILFSLFLTLSAVATAQMMGDTININQLPIVKIIIKDQSFYIGKMVEDDGIHIVIKTDDKTYYYINKDNIDFMGLYDEEAEKLSALAAASDSVIVNGNVKPFGNAPYDTRYYYSSNAIPLKKGENYSMFHLYGPEFHVAATDHLSIGFMSSWIASPVALSAKYTIPTSNEKVNFSISTMMFSIGYLFKSKTWGGLHSGTLTIGSRNKNISFTSGFGHLKLDFGVEAKDVTYTGIRKALVSSIAGVVPLNRKVSFVFDSMISISKRRNYYMHSYYINDLDGGEYWWTPEITKKGTEINSLIMPGFRFRNSEKNAFQITLAGVIQYSSIGFDRPEYSVTERVRSFPVPMCSWFIKL